MGTKRGTQVLEAAVAAPYVLALAGAAAGALPLGVLAFSAFSLPAARDLVLFARENHRVAARIAPLKRYAIRWHVAFALALVAGLAQAAGAARGASVCIPAVPGF
ncbi:hypothetical protein MNEG_12357 [Monoraphidium neglectum]|uniref:Uncharacterized protein n=1 Tax=Monoraphidium neglectum TaxID=145388 RepID=A0A0D2KIJ9_9CHLO|nr:hypothetical protein MNEG_12357 [Monoraphidium neglectum]KIY95603.1 hypothetical protein MNEG_12357 [Monoraphidium neglectum]|eukprot:XP_013894623.1 hypothetical protein MNEG_12357 [Monoraphidium neglectum]